jgi:hypothetical protein
MAKPILVVRLNFMTPREQIDGFQQVLENKCDDYHVLCVASQNPELTLEVHAVDEKKVKKFDGLRKELLIDFKTLQDEQAENDKDGKVVDMPVSSKGADS